MITLAMLILLTSSIYVPNGPVSSTSFSYTSISGVPPPPSGTWNVTEPTTVEGEVLIINGDINITSSLTIIDSIIYLNRSAGADYIYVAPGGSLTLTDSTITPLQDGYGKIIINASSESNFEMRGSTIEALDSTIYFEIHIYSDNAYFKDSVIDTSDYGDIYFYGDHLRFINVSIACDELNFGSPDSQDLLLREVTVNADDYTNILSDSVYITNSKFLLEDDFNIYGSNVSIFNTKIAGTYSYYNLYIAGSSANVTFQNVTVDLEFRLSGDNVTIRDSTLNQLCYISSASMNITILRTTIKGYVGAYGDYLKIVNCTLITGESPLSIGGEHIIIENCGIYSEQRAIDMYSASKYVTIKGNVIYGCCEFDGDNLEIVDNVVISNYQFLGIEIKDGKNRIFRNNYVYNGSFLVWDTDLTNLGTYTFENNYVNDLPVYFWVSKTVEEIIKEKIGTLILIRCKNITIRDSFAYGIFIQYGENFIIEDTIITRAHCGLFLGGSISNIYIWNASIIRNYYGIRFQSIVNLTVLNSTIAFNQYHGVTYYSPAYPSNIHIHNCSIMSNVGCGIYVTSAIFVNATYNWWGSELGPDETSRGDPFDPEEVYGNVDYDPWLERPATSIDTTPPSVSITSPEQGAYVSNNTVDIIIEASDDSGIDYIDVYGDDKLIARLRIPPYKVTWTTTAGEHEVVVYAYDLYGNSNSTSVTFTVDLEPPQVEILSPEMNAYIGGNVTISISAQDDVGVDKVEIYIDNQKVAELTESPYTYVWNTANYDDGSHTIKAKAYDLGGLTSEDEITVYVDNTPPDIGDISVIKGTYINDTAMANVVIKVEVSDAVSGVAEVILQYRIGETGEWKSITMTRTDNVWEGTIPEVPAKQTIYVKIIATDNAGNTAIKETSFEIPARPGLRISTIALYVGILIGVLIAILIIVKFIKRR